MANQWLLYLSGGAGVCTLLGALLLFGKKYWSAASLAFFLGLAAGVMSAVVLADMLPTAFFNAGIFKTGLGLLSGLVLMYLYQKIFMDRLSARPSMVRLGYLIMMGIALHDLPEGMAIALAGEMKYHTAKVIALGIGLHNIPEGMAIAAPLLMANTSKIKIIVQVALIGLITPFGTWLGQASAVHWPGLIGPLLGLASGVMAYIVICQLWPQSREQNKKNAQLGFWLGVVIILLVTFTE